MTNESAISCCNETAASRVCCQLFIQGELLDRGIAAAGAILFSMFIIFDTHMIMHKVSPEEYIHASVNLYLDIINLFLHILRLLGERKN